MNRIKATEIARLRELFIRRMTVDRDGGNTAIFGVRPDGSTYQCYNGTEMQMVLNCFDDAVAEYVEGHEARGKVDTHTREGISHA